MGKELFSVLLIIYSAYMVITSIRTASTNPRSKMKILVGVAVIVIMSVTLFAKL